MALDFRSLLRGRRVGRRRGQGVARKEGCADGGQKRGQEGGAKEVRAEEVVEVPIRKHLAWSV